MSDNSSARLTSKAPKITPMRSAAPFLAPVRTGRLLLDSIVTRVPGRSRPTLFVIRPDAQTPVSEQGMGVVAAHLRRALASPFPENAR